MVVRAPSDFDSDLMPQMQVPTLTIKNCVKNDGGVQKQSAVSEYDK